MALSLRTMLIFALFITPAITYGQGLGDRPGDIRQGIRAEAACAIAGMSAEQAQLTALQRARAAAIEQAAGVSVTSASLVTNATLTGDFIKTYARGYIVREKVEWLPLGQYQKDASTAPIPEYRVRITADVYCPERKPQGLRLRARLNAPVFRKGEKASIAVQANQEARVAIFNITADDQVVLLFPNAHAPEHLLPAGRDVIFPDKDAKVELEMEPLPGHQRDAEAFLICAWDRDQAIRILERFPEGKPLAFAAFFARLAETAPEAETILPYEVVGTP